MQGNPLAVVLDSQGLDTNQMQAIAREFNLSETVFVSPPKDASNTAAIRIFTPIKELPFAGHPTIGTAILLGVLDAPDIMRGKGGIVIALEEQVGTLKVDVIHHATLGLRAVFEIPQLSQRIEVEFDNTFISQALGLELSDIDFKNHIPSVWSAGVPFAMVPVNSLEAMGRIKIADSALWHKAFANCETQAVFAYTEETVDPNHHVHARMFAPRFGITEDPATGSAAAAFSGVAAEFERPKDGTHQLVIEQGYKIGRPSQIALDLDIVNGKAQTVRVGGGAVIISEGKLHL